MTTTPTVVATTTAAVGAGLSAGVFLSFSTFVMSGLRRVPDTVGLQAMQGVNRAAPASPLFMLVLFGTALLCVVLGVRSAVRLSEPGALLTLLGAAAFLVSIVLTAAYHVPHNDALARLAVDAPGSADAWRAYLSSWTAWNHVRTLACTVATVLLVLAGRVV